jgi:hypothetical protein
MKEPLMSEAVTTMTPEQTEALDALLKHVLENKASSYDGSAAHIYHAVYVLAQMRGLEAKSPDELEREMREEAAEVMRSIDEINAAVSSRH